MYCGIGACSALCVNRYSIQCIKPNRYEMMWKIHAGKNAQRKRVLKDLEVFAVEWSGTDTWAASPSRVEARWSARVDRVVARRTQVWFREDHRLLDD